MSIRENERSGFHFGFVEPEMPVGSNKKAFDRELNPWSNG